MNPEIPHRGVRLIDETHYSLLIDDDRFDLDSHITIGRHLDNDLVIAGEDVLDFHARIELKARGPRIVRLNNAPLHINDLSVEDATGLIPDDEIILGQHRIQLVVDYLEDPVRNWKLVSRGGSSSIHVGSEMLVGRSADCDLCISEGYVSRKHANIFVRADQVWIRDLGSSNGTFINGDRLSGAARLLHGDELAFDTTSFRLVGEAPHLTPVVEHKGQYAEVLASLAEKTESPYTQSPLISTVEIPPEESPLRTSVGPDIHPSQSNSPGQMTLVGLSEPVSDLVFELTLGHYQIGRERQSDISIQESSVSARHAELDVRLDGVYMTNLVATNGTRVNHAEIQTVKLSHGDIIDLGRVSLLFSDQVPVLKSTMHRSRLPLTVIGSLALLGFLVYLFV